MESEVGEIERLVNDSYKLWIACIDDAVRKLPKPREVPEIHSSLGPIGELTLRLGVSPSKEERIIEEEARARFKEEAQNLGVSNPNLILWPFLGHIIAKGYKITFGQEPRTSSTPTLIELAVPRQEIRFFLNKASDPFQDFLDAYRFVLSYHQELTQGEMGQLEKILGKKMPGTQIELSNYTDPSNFSEQDRELAGILNQLRGKNGFSEDGMKALKKSAYYPILERFKQTYPSEREVDELKKKGIVPREAESIRRLIGEYGNVQMAIQEILSDSYYFRSDFESTDGSIQRFRGFYQQLINSFSERSKAILDYCLRRGELLVAGKVGYNGKKAEWMNIGDIFVPFSSIGNGRLTYLLGMLNK